MKKFNLLLPLLLLIFSAGALKAQLVGTEAYMQGDFLEVGVAACGSYGTQNAPPAGYHPRGGATPGVGFVADFGMDGWAVGSPDYCGDYFLPGSPVEGWGVQIGANSYLNTSGFAICNAYAIPGSVTSYAVTSGNIEVTWDGSVAGLDIHQYTYFPDTALWFVTKVDMTNTTASPMVNVYYGRNLDPDNDVALAGGSFTTTNTIISQPGTTGTGTSCDAYVQSIGQPFGCYLGLGARSENARVAYGSFFTPDSIKWIWDGAAAGGYTGTVGSTAVGDIGNSLAFYFDVIDPGQTVSLAFAYVLNAADLEVALSATGGARFLADTTDITASGTVTICPGASVSLNAEADTTYDWVWSPDYNISDTTGASVVVSPDTTTTYIAHGTNGPCGEIFREITVIIDTIRVDAGPDDTICVGDTIALRAYNAFGTTYWTPNATLYWDSTASPRAFPPVTTMYTVHSACGTDSMTLWVAPTYAMDAFGDTAICLGDSTYLGLSLPAGLFYTSWAPGPMVGTGTTTPLVFPNANTTYTATVVSAAGCLIEDTVQVDIRGAVPNISVSASDYSVCAGAESHLLVNTGSGTCYEYDVTAIPFEPSTGSGVAISLLNGFMSPPISIGFSFPYFCDFYEELYISNNGFVTFDNTFDGCCTGQFLPTPFAPNNVIAAAWNDLDPGYGGAKVQYFTEGFAPDRRFVVSFENVPHRFPAGSNPVTFQIMLYENGKVEIHTTSQPDPSGITTMGIENAAGTYGVAVPGRNASTWTATNDAYQFNPTPAPTGFDITWTPSALLDNDTIGTPTATMDYSTSFHVIVDDHGCIAEEDIFIRADTGVTITSVGVDTQICYGQTVELFVEYDTAVSPYVALRCDEYEVSNIPVSVLTGSGTYVFLTDDEISAGIPLGFDFNFYCNDYNTVYLSSNGFVTFTPGDPGCCDGQMIPNPSDPNNLIAGAWANWNPAGGGFIDWFINGTAPNRVFTVEYVNVPNSGAFVSGTVTMQISLFETSNNIEVHIINQSAFIGGLKTLGVENATGTIATPAPGRNALAWTTTNEGWRFVQKFTPHPGPITYSWTPGSTLDDDSIQYPIASPTSTTTYTVLVGNRECPDYAEVTVIVGDPDATAGRDTTLCGPSVVRMNASGGASYSWAPATGLSATNVANPLATLSSTQTYAVTIDDGTGCLSIDTVTVFINPVIIHPLGPDQTICSGTATTLDATSAWNSIVWSNGTLGQFNTITADADYWFTGIDPATGCPMLSDTMHLFLTAAPPVDLGPDRDLCFGETDTLDAGFNTGAAYLWNTGEISQFIEITLPGTYWVRKSIGSCESFDTINVGLLPGITIDLGADITACCGFDIIFSTPSPFAAYQWSTGDTTSFITVTTTGVYSLTVTNATGCKAHDSVSAFINCILPDALADPDVIMGGGSTDLSATTAYTGTFSFDWTPPATLSTPTAQTTTATPVATTTYEVCVTDDVTGCTECDTVMVIVADTMKISIPNAFSPNGDGLNELFEPLLSGDAVLLDIRIYNRWGDLLHSGIEGWDGTYNSTEQPTGTYVYIISIDTTDPDSPLTRKTNVYQGSLDLIR